MNLFIFWAIIIVLLFIEFLILEKIIKIRKSFFIIIIKSFILPLNLKEINSQSLYNHEIIN